MNKIVFITGGASGLGRVLVDAFVNRGYKVFFTYKNSKDNAEKIAKKYGDKVAFTKADASSFEEALDSINKCVDAFGTIDVLINNAASARDSSIENISKENFEYTLDNVLMPVFNYTKLVIDIMKNNGKGKIINIGSINGIRGREGSVAYSTAKAGIIGFTKTVAKELGQYNINCNVVAPGYINTDGQRNTSELIKKLVLSECAIRKLATPEEISNLIAFLASDEADCITGQVYQIDNGQYI